MSTNKVVAEIFELALGSSSISLNSLPGVFNPFTNAFREDRPMLALTIFALEFLASLEPIDERRFGMDAVGGATQFGCALQALANAADVAPLMLEVAPPLVRPLLVTQLHFSYLMHGLICELSCNWGAKRKVRTKDDHN
jgi:hypothetical protein